MSTSEVVSVLLTVLAISTAIGVVVLEEPLHALGKKFLERKAVRSLVGASPVDVPSELQVYSLFLPEARWRGLGAGVIDRTAEVRDVRVLLSQKSVTLVTGLQGAGKTTIAAHVAASMGRRRHVRFIACAYHRGDLSLRYFATALAFDSGLPKNESLRSMVQTKDTSALINALIRYLTDHRVVLVFDDYHLVEDPELARLASEISESTLSSDLLLTSRQDLPGLHPAPFLGHRHIDGLAKEPARVFLRTHGLGATDDVLDAIWQAAQGLPEGMLVFAGLTRSRGTDNAFQLTKSRPGDLNTWVADLFEDLDPSEQDLTKLIVYTHAPVTAQQLREMYDATADFDSALDGLLDKFVAREVGGEIVVHEVFREVVRSLVDPAEEDRYSDTIARYYQRRARNLLKGIGEEPSYGLLYLEAFPDYVKEVERHRNFIDDLATRLSDSGLGLATDARVLVLGSGNGIHDSGLLRHCGQVIDLDIQPEVAHLGRAARPDDRTSYVVADMTKSLPFADGSVDAVFNVGSSFGFEELDETNGSILVHAAKVLRSGGVFVFEYANGQYWGRQRSMRRLDETRLPDGSVRSTYGVVDAVRRTSLTSISLIRANGTGGWFHHFIHYYTVSEVTEMMRAAGFSQQIVFGGVRGRVTGAPFDPQESDSMVILATKV